MMTPQKEKLFREFLQPLVNYYGFPTRLKTKEEKQSLFDLIWAIVVQQDLCSFILSLRFIFVNSPFEYVEVHRVMRQPAIL